MKAFFAFLGVVALLLSVAFVVMDETDTEIVAETTEEAPEPAPVETETVMVSPEFDYNAMADAINEVFTDFEPGELVVGENVNFETAAQERGTSAFSQETLESPEDIKEFLASDDERAAAMREYISTAIRAEGYGDDEVERAMNGEGYFPVQATVPVEIAGTTYYVDGEVYESEGWRRADEGDIFWLYVASDNATVIFGASIRADCANPNLHEVTPDKPDRPDIPVEEDGKDHNRSPVSDDLNDPDERVRPNEGEQDDVYEGETPPPASSTTVDDSDDQETEQEDDRPPHSGTPGSGEADPADPDPEPLPPGGSEGTSDPEPEPTPVPEDDPPVEDDPENPGNGDGDLCEQEPDHVMCG